jgi:hypothetical protein
MSLEMAHKVILPPKKNYIPQFLKQRDINSYCEHRSPEYTNQPPLKCEGGTINAADGNDDITCCLDVETKESKIHAVYSTSNHGIK